MQELAAAGKWQIEEFLEGDGPFYAGVLSKLF